eukprot:TRINITY_DN1875_c0_g1_i1.p1 TRINITY_DN1875_c0_g1~~TRINITY_DN1875_c0_g1_i1.p1  ORF type:complete len:573 (-),score=34.93 TRINITY_DN1875_c0_g1_i1:61-1779(-)
MALVAPLPQACPLFENKNHGTRKSVPLIFAQDFQCVSHTGKMFFPGLVSYSNRLQWAPRAYTKCHDGVFHHSPSGPFSAPSCLWAHGLLSKVWENERQRLGTAGSDRRVSSSVVFASPSPLSCCPPPRILRDAELRAIQRRGDVRSNLLGGMSQRTRWPSCDVVCFKANPLSGVSSASYAHHLYYPLYALWRKRHVASTWPIVRHCITHVVSSYPKPLPLESIQFKDALQDKLVRETLGEIMSRSFEELQLSSLAETNMWYVLNNGATYDIALLLWRVRRSWLSAGDRREELASMLSLWSKYGFSAEDFFDSVTSDPRGGRQSVLSIPLEEMEERFQGLQRLVGAGNKLSQSGRTICRLLMIPKEVMEQKAEQLEELGLDSGRLILRAPYVLNYSMDSVRRKLNSLKGIVLLDDEGLAALVKRSPGLLRASKVTVETNFATLSAWLGSENAQRAILKDPLVASLGTNVLKGKLESFTACFGLEMAKNIVLQTPSVLKLSWETNLSPKIEFVLGTMGRSKEELVRGHAVLTRSLKLRLQPRYERLKRVGKQEECSVSALATLTDVGFKKRFNC